MTACPRRVLVAGATNPLGGLLCHAFAARGRTVIGATRGARR